MAGLGVITEDYNVEKRLILAVPHRMLLGDDEPAPILAEHAPVPRVRRRSRAVRSKRLYHFRQRPHAGLPFATWPPSELATIRSEQSKRCAVTRDLCRFRFGAIPSALWRMLQLLE